MPSKARRPGVVSRRRPTLSPAAAALSLPPSRPRRVAPPSLFLPFAAAMATAGISELMSAENRASQIVAEARAARGERMKEAKREAEAVIGKVRAEKEAAFQSSSNETQNQDEFSDMKKVTDAEIAEMQPVPAPGGARGARGTPRVPRQAPLRDEQGLGDGHDRQGRHGREPGPLRDAQARRPTGQRPGVSGRRRRRAPRRRPGGRARVSIPTWPAAIAPRVVARSTVAEFGSGSPCPPAGRVDLVRGTRARSGGRPSRDDDDDGRITTSGGSRGLHVGGGKGGRGLAGALRKRS